jgi:hypothetical protein
MGYRLKPGYLRTHHCHQLPPGRGQGVQIRARVAPAPAGGPRPDVDDANARARGPAPGPRPCASAGSARGDRACHAARTVRSWQPCAGRESDSPGSTPPHARCRSYGTGKRRLSLGSRPRKWPACAGSKKTPDLLHSRDASLCSCQGPEQHPNSTPPGPAAPEDRASRHRSSTCAEGRRTFDSCAGDWRRRLDRVT